MSAPAFRPGLLDQAKSTNLLNGISLSRVPVAAKIALTSAAAGGAIRDEK